MVKIGSTNALPNNIPIITSRSYWHLLLFSDFFQLWSDFPNFPHCFCMNEVIIAPSRRVPYKLNKLSINKNYRFFFSCREMNSRVHPDVVAHCFWPNTTGNIEKYGSIYGSREVDQWKGAHYIVMPTKR